MDSLSAVLGDNVSRVVDGGAYTGHPFQKAWLIKPATLVSIFLSMIFLSLSLCFIWYGIVDSAPPIRIISAVASRQDPNTGVLEVTVTAQKSRYCHGRRYGFIHDRYSFGIDPVEIPPQGFRGPTPTDGIVKWTFPVDVKDYFWQDGEGFTYRAEWRFRCNPLQGTLFPEVVVTSPDIIVPRS